MPVLRETEARTVPGHFTMEGDAGLLGGPLGNSSYFRDHLEEERTEAQHVRKHVRGMGISVSTQRGNVDMAPRLVQPIDSTDRLERDRP